MKRLLTLPFVACAAGASLVAACGSDPSIGAQTDAAAPTVDAASGADATADAAAPGPTSDAGAVDAPPLRDAASLLRPLAPIPAGPHWPAAVATSKDGVYVVSPVGADAGALDRPTQIVRLALDGSWQTVFQSPGYIYDVAADDSGVYYSDRVGLHRVASDGGASVQLTSDPQPVGPMILHDGNLFYGTDDDLAQVYRVPTGGAPPTGLATQLYQPDSLAVAKDGIYVTEGGRLKVLPLAGGEPTLLARPVQGVVSYDGVAYVGDVARAGLLRVTPDGGVTPFAAGTSINGHTVDASGVYFVDARGLWRAPLDQSDVVRIALPLPPDGFLHRMALDATRIYIAAEWLYAADKADPK